MKKIALTLLLIISGSTPAFAHLIPNANDSFATGFSHPMLGLDHLLVMFAVGLWAWQIGRHALWVVPGSFVSAMVLGFLLALVGIPLPFVEPAILASVVALGLLVALAINVPVPLSALVVGGFALFHGYAHGGEIGSATQLGYAAGFAIATAILHAAGMAIGFALSKIFGGRSEVAMYAARVLGGLTFVAGVGLLTA